jgi:hypothetical protein
MDVLQSMAIPRENMSYYNRAFITGCDNKTEWMLEWFLKNYLKHNDTPIIFCDFGVSADTLAWIKTVSEFVDIYTLQKQKKEGWFYKPAALLQAPVKEKIWIDTDIHVLGNIAGAFNYIEDDKLAMVEDRPWSKRRGEKWHNSGFVGVRDTPHILKKWYENTLHTAQVGDQEVLHEMVRLDSLTRMRYISDIPNIYNWLRLQVTHDNEDNANKLCMHWTGEKGKNEIRKMIYNG